MRCAAGAPMLFSCLPACTGDDESSSSSSSTSASTSFASEGTIWVGTKREDRTFAWDDLDDDSFTTGAEVEIFTIREPHGAGSTMRQIQLNIHATLGLFQVNGGFFEPTGLWKMTGVAPVPAG